MAVIVGLSIWATRGLQVEYPISKKQHVMETIVELIESQIKESSGEKARPYLPFIGTLFLFIAVSNLLSIFPPLSGFFPGALSIYRQPTTALETTVALAVCVFFSVPVYAIAQRGIGHWLKSYIRPTYIMLPFNIIGDISRTLALAVRLFGNMMSGTVVGAILLSLIPFFFPVIMQVFGLLTGMIQAYIFAVLAMVYIASAVQVDQERNKRN